MWHYATVFFRFDSLVLRELPSVLRSSFNLVIFCELSSLLSLQHMIYLYRNFCINSLILASDDLHIRARTITSEQYWQSSWHETGDGLFRTMKVYLRDLFQRDIPSAWHFVRTTFHLRAFNCDIPRVRDPKNLLQNVCLNFTARLS